MKVDQNLIKILIIAVKLMYKRFKNFRAGADFFCFTSRAPSDRAFLLEAFRICAVVSILHRVESAHLQTEDRKHGTQVV